MDLSEIPRDRAARHPWEVSRQRFFAGVLAEVGPAALAVLDAGAGDGWFSSQLGPVLPADVRITCWDAEYTAQQLADFNARGSRQTFTAGLPSGTFDLLLLLDVLEHVEDDAKFLRSLVERLAPGGWALISVPAWQQLYTSHDRRLRHFRRYSPRQATAVLRTSGLDVQSSGGLFHGLLAARGLSWLRERIRPPRESDVAAHDLGWRRGPLVTGAVQGALALDNRLSSTLAARGLDVPGLSWWALCQRSS